MDTRSVGRVQFGKEASQTRGSPRFLTAQRTLVRNDNGTVPDQFQSPARTCYNSGCPVRGAAAGGVRNRRDEPPPRPRFYRPSRLDEGETVVHTMREVAKRAGVSPATVSRVLNKTRYIAPETERRVLEVVGKLNYYKNVHAR